MLKIGITGGIGSGKSTISRLFSLLGIPVYYADRAAKKLMAEDLELRQAIIENFGPEIYTGDELNRAQLAEIVFRDNRKLQLLNSLVHPATIRESQNWMLAQSTPYAIKEAALIFESGSQDQLDFVIGVYAPESLRILRVMKRDGSPREKILARMKEQIDESIKMRLCQAVIINDEQHLVIPQVLELHNKFLSMSKKTPEFMSNF